jgi:hypothetical protein
VPPSGRKPLIRTWGRAAGCDRLKAPARLLIAAGVNAKALSVYMRHASVMITLDRYGHLMPGNEEGAAGLLDNYLSRSTGGAGSACEGQDQWSSGRSRIDRDSYHSEST